MNRILLALVLSLSCTAAFAGIPSVTDYNHINCPKSGKLDSVPASPPPAAPVASPAPAKSSGAIAVDHGSAMPAHGVAPRIISPRWHSFLPGMFR